MIKNTSKLEQVENLECPNFIKKIFQILEVLYNN